MKFESLMKISSWYDRNIMIICLVIGAFIFPPLLLCPATVSSDLTSHARKRKHFARTKFIWPMDNLIKKKSINNLLIQTWLFGFHRQPYLNRPGIVFYLVCDFLFVFSGWNYVCMKFSDHNQWFYPHSKRLTYPTSKWHYYIYCNHTLLHVLKIVSEFLRNPQCHGNFSFCIDIGIWATDGLVINPCTLNDTEAHPNFV
jgi:hypothetical protein